VGNRVRRVCVCAHGGGRLNRWDTATEEPHLPHLSISVQPRVCGYSESVYVYIDFFMNEKTDIQINVEKQEETKQTFRHFHVFIRVLGLCVYIDT